MVDLNAVNVAVENKSQQRSQFWVEKIKSTLNSRENTMGDPMRSYTELSVSYISFICLLCSHRGQHESQGNPFHHFVSRSNIS
jgi:phosphatidylinositol-bisphosphatase